MIDMSRPRQDITARLKKNKTYLEMRHEKDLTEQELATTLTNTY